MKYERLVSSTFLNSFILLILGSLLTSCDKTTYSSKGLFTKINQQYKQQYLDDGRSIASVNPKDTLSKFEKFQDPKQIFIYCSLNTKKEKICYNSELEKVLTKFKNKFGPLKPEEIKNIKDQYSYPVTQSTLKEVVKSISYKTTGNLNKIVNKRKNFCRRNSKKYLDRCLLQYLEKDTFSVLNKFHSKHKLNGHEYLYVKNKIKEQFETEFIQAKALIKHGS